MAAAHQIQGDALIFDGEFETATVRSAIAEVGRRDVRRVVVTSRGGDVLSGLMFAEWIHSRGMDVEVRGICASSCANYVFAAGRRKTLAAGSLLIWHGGAFQQNFVAFAKAYEAALWRREMGQPEREDTKLLQASERYEMVKLQQARERDFYAAVNVDPALPSLGHLKPEPHLPWTLTPGAMSEAGLRAVSVPPGYATSAYLNEWKTQRYGEAQAPAISVLDRQDVKALTSNRRP